MRSTAKRRAFAEWERQDLEGKEDLLMAAIERQKKEFLPYVHPWPSMEVWLKYKMWEITDLGKFMAALSFIHHDSGAGDAS